METKKITLRSQTVQCPHCGEYYSVTYKYCPFCDAGRKEEERRQAAKRQRTKDFFGSLFGSHAEKSEGEAKKTAGEAAPAAEEDLGPELLDAVQPKKKAPKPTAHPRKGKAEAKAKEHPVREAAHTKETTHRRRKKTSEMTEEEKAADRAEREARAAARKRERDRKAREAALAAAEAAESPAAPAQEEAQPAQVEMAPGESGPVFEEVTVPETFGYDEPPLVEPGPAQVTVDDVVVEEGTPPETRTFSPQPQQAAPAQEPPAGEAAAASAQPAPATEWDALKDLDPLAGVSAAPEIPDPIPAPAAEVQVGDQTVEPAPQPAQTTPPEDDLDALLREVRGLLADSPVPTLTQEQMEKPAAPVEEVALQEEPAPVEEAAPAPEAEPAQQAAPTQQAAPARAEFDVEEPTIHIGEIPTDTLWQRGGGEKPAAENYTQAVDDEPTQVIPTGEISQAVQAQQAAQEATPAPEAAPAQEDLLEAVLPPKAPEERKPEPRRTERRKKKKGGPNPVLIVVSLAIIVAAIFIVMRTVVPAFQTGLFSSNTPAESLTLDMSQLDLAEAGTTINLVPTFSPEGSTGTLTWTSSDESVATVDAQGMVTAVAPGNATITATLENGQSATCNVTCTWDSQGTDAAGEEPPAEETPASPALTPNDITLDTEGDSQQLTLTGVEGDVTWASGDTAVATVDNQGNVTATGPGRTTVTATVGEQTFKCEVRCIW